MRHEHNNGAASAAGTESHTNQYLIDEIRHAFDDAGLNASMADSEDESKETYRDMLEMHFEHTQERYGLTDDAFRAVIEKVAIEIGAKEDYDWAYGAGK
jgi:hypothetical protein